MNNYWSDNSIENELFNKEQIKSITSVITKAVVNVIEKQCSSLINNTSEVEVQS